MSGAPAEDIGPAKVVPTSQLDPDSRVRRLKRWFKDSLPVVEKWRQEAQTAYEFKDGHQWDEKDEAKLKEEGRPAVVFNRIGPTVDVTSGIEINQAQEIVCKQVGTEDTEIAEAATALIEWAGDDCDAQREHSAAFQDALIGGMGWIEVRIDDIGYVRVVDERIDPFEMVWDVRATRRNFMDGRFVFRAKEMALEAAQEMFPEALEEDLGNNWHLAGDDDKPGSDRRGYRYGNHEGDKPETVTILECQWRELEMVTMVGGQEVPPDMLEQLMAQAQVMGSPPPPVQSVKRWCVYQVFIGRDELQAPVKLPSGGDLAYQCVTGKWDRKQGYHYGIVRAAMDPQRYANKWMLQQLHILNTTAKNTILYEEGAFVDENAAKKEWAQPGAMVQARPGALVNNRIQVITGQTMQAVLGELMMFALNSIRDCTGINLELLGMQQREQAGVLEQERKKAAVTILAVFFDNLTAARKTIGRLRLKYLTSGVIPPEELVMAIGQKNAQFLPMLMGDQALRFDINVDESPSSPNAKERAWSALNNSGILPVLMKREDLGPEVWAALIDVLPVSSGIAIALKNAIGTPKPPDPMAEAMKQIEARGRMAEVTVDESKTALQYAQAGKAEAEGQRAMLEPLVPPQPPMIDGSPP